MLIISVFASPHPKVFKRNFPLGHQKLSFCSKGLKKKIANYFVNKIKWVTLSGINRESLVLRLKLNMSLSNIQYKGVKYANVM